MVDMSASIELPAGWEAEVRGAPVSAHVELAISALRQRAVASLSRLPDPAPTHWRRARPPTG